MVRAPLEFGLQSGSGSGSDRIQGSNWVQVQAPIGFGLHSGSSSDRVQTLLEFRLRSGSGAARVRAPHGFGLCSGSDFARGVRAMIQNSFLKVFFPPQSFQAVF